MTDRLLVVADEHHPREEKSTSPEPEPPRTSSPREGDLLDLGRMSISSGLHFAATRGYVNWVQRHIESGGDLNEHNMWGATALHAAAEEPTGLVLRLLVIAGAQLDVVDHENRTPLHCAVGSAEHVEVLVLAGADTSIRDKSGKTARDLAVDADEIFSVEVIDGGIGHAATFNRVQASLASAHEMRAHLTDVCAAFDLVEQFEARTGEFAFIGALIAASESLMSAEQYFHDLQHRLRVATSLDEDVVTERNAARDQLTALAAALVAAHSAVPRSALGNARAQLQKCRRALVKWDTTTIAASTSAGWLVNAKAKLEMCTAATEASAETMFAALAAFTRDVKSAERASQSMGRCVITSEFECELLRSLGMTVDVAESLVRRLDETLSQCDRIAALLDRAHRMRVVSSPDGSRFQAAQDAVNEARKQHAIAAITLTWTKGNNQDAQSVLLDRKTVRDAAIKEEMAAVIELGASLHDFPELVLRHPGARLDVLAQSVADGADAASALRTLEAFEERRPIAGTRHVVESAQIGGALCALKLFRVGEHGQRAFLKEARHLRQLAHPNVAQLRAAFVDRNGAGELVGVIEMPLYTYGSLWTWLAAAPRGVVDRVGVLRHALSGLAHVHRMGVVHGDVKPDNVFVDDAGVAKLGDFDVSRQVDASGTQTMTRVGLTHAYCAPELLVSSMPRKESDMFAFGSTVFDIVRGVQQPLLRPIDIGLLAVGDGLRESVRLLIGGRNRAIVQVLQKRFMLNAHSHRRRQDDIRSHDRRKCVLCFDQFWAHEGLDCDSVDGGESRHFVCAECAAGWVSSMVDEPVAFVTMLRCFAHRVRPRVWTCARGRSALVTLYLHSTCKS
jgi:serine/threonine protein kinase